MPCGKVWFARAEDEPIVQRLFLVMMEKATGLILDDEPDKTFVHMVAHLRASLCSEQELCCIVGIDSRQYASPTSHS